MIDSLAKQEQIEVLKRIQAHLEAHYVTTAFEPKETPPSKPSRTRKSKNGTAAAA